MKKNLIKIPEIFDDCLLYFVQNPDHIPFGIKRVYYIVKSDPKFTRGYHAHKKTDQALFCIQGSVKIVVDDGQERQKLILDHPGVGMVINRLIWHEMHDFEENTILLVLASRIFDAGDYIRDYDQFLKLVHGKKKR